MSVRYTVLGFELRHLEHESPLITTKPGLPPFQQALLVSTGFSSPRLHFRVQAKLSGYIRAQTNMSSKFISSFKQVNASLGKINHSEKCSLSSLGNPSMYESLTSPRVARSTFLGKCVVYQLVSQAKTSGDSLPRLTTAAGISNIELCLQNQKTSL